MDELIAKGYARKAQGDGPKGSTWYLPHHGVFSEAKQKIRVVFDCGAEFQGESLNQNLISGPDLTSQLVGILLRFREYPIAVMADIEKMFYQVRVAEHHRSLLRYLWWPNGDLNTQPIDYEMNVHVFGATSSPSCSNYALRRTSIDNEHKYPPAVTESLKNNFCVDDLLKSFKTLDEAVKFVSEVSPLCNEGGFNLTKFISNSVPVLETISEGKRNPAVTKPTIGKLPTDTCLGIKWDIQNDSFGFDVKFTTKPLTRRGMLSRLSSVYDPCGYVAPLLLKGRRIIQSTCRMNLSWDDEIPKPLKDEWSNWCVSLESLSNFTIRRCFQPENFGEVSNCTLHHFSDASEYGYGQVSYFRLINTNGKIHCSLVMSKARVTPLKYVSMPRLELVAATLSMKVSCFIKEETTYVIDTEYFWTDSQVVLSYINNEEKRFKIFVANRIQYIRDHSSLEQWRYVPSKMNPGDITSRGFEREDQIEAWYKGPSFLLEPEDMWPTISPCTPINGIDPEVKINVHVIHTDESLLTHLEERISCWQRMKRIVAILLRYIKNLKLKSTNSQMDTSSLNVEELKTSKNHLIKLAQIRAYPEETKNLKNGRSLKPTSSILPLAPYLDEIGFLRVGGRLSAETLGPELVHPLVIPKCQLGVLIARWCHQKVEHGGRNLTLNEIRSTGFWIVRGNTVVRSLIYTCVTCRRLCATTAVQMMGKLPKDRQSSEAPFSYVGLDMVGPFLVKDKRSRAKRYGVMFTCLNSRAVHIETTHSLDTDSFMLSLRRFIARRGNIRELRSDNGTNFVGSKSELIKAFNEIDHDKIRFFLRNHGTDWLVWKNNPPAASHMGGVWERQIRSARAVLTAILMVHPGQLTDESLRTYLAEVEGIINSRPLTTETINDVNSLQPISPSMLLTQKTKIIMPPPGKFMPAGDDGMVRSVQLVMSNEDRSKRVELTRPITKLVLLIEASKCSIPRRGSLDCYIGQGDWHLEGSQMKWLISIFVFL